MTEHIDKVIIYMNILLDSKQLLMEISTVATCELIYPNPPFL